MEKFIKYFTIFEVVALACVLFNKKLSFLNFNVVVVTKGNLIISKDGTPLEVSCDENGLIKG